MSNYRSRGQDPQHQREELERKNHGKAVRSVKKRLTKLKEDLAIITQKETRQQGDHIRFQAKRAKNHRRTKKKFAKSQNELNMVTGKKMNILKASSSPVDEPYTMEHGIATEYAVAANELKNIQDAITKSTDEIIKITNQPQSKMLSKKEMLEAKDKGKQMNSLRDTNASNLNNYNELNELLKDPLGIISEIYPEMLENNAIVENYDPKLAIPSNFTGSPTFSEGEFDSLSPPNYTEDMPSLTGFKLTAENLANMERGNEMNLARQIRASQAMPVQSRDRREHKSNKGVTDIERERQEAEFAEQEAEIAKEEAILVQEEAITQRMLRDTTGLRISSQDERDIAEELEEMERDAGRNRKRRTRRKHKKKKHKKQKKKKKTHKKKKKRRKKKGGTRKKKGGTRKNRRR